MEARSTIAQTLKTLTIADYWGEGGGYWKTPTQKSPISDKISDSEEEVWKLSNAVMGLSERQKIAIAREEKVHAHL